MTYQKIFELSMDLIDERLPSGLISASDTVDYKVKTPGILSILQAELGKAEGIDALLIESLEEESMLNDFQNIAVLPYGLAAHLLLDENPDAASYFSQRYEELKKKTPGIRSSTTDVYNMSGSWNGW